VRTPRNHRLAVLHPGVPIALAILSLSAATLFQRFLVSLAFTAHALP
jgi:hypothetical protein